MTSHVCDHCGRPLRGWAVLRRGGITFHLCHPGVGLDCYRLVTVYNEPIGLRRQPAEE